MRVAAVESLTAGGDRTLAEHLEAVGHYAKNLVQNKGDCALLNRSSISASKFAFVLGATHDVAKATKSFQEYVRDPDQETTPPFARHSTLSAFYTYHVLSKRGAPRRECLFGWQIVQRHHAGPNSLFGQREGPGRIAGASSMTERLQKQARKLEQERLFPILDTLNVNHLESFLKRVETGAIFEDVRNDTLRLEMETFDFEDVFWFQFMNAVLLDADKMHAAGFHNWADWPSVGSRSSFDSETVDRYIDDELTVQSKLDEFRSARYQEAEETLLDRDSGYHVLQLATGGGKTLNALNLALKRRQERNKRDEGTPSPSIIYAVPFLSIADQNMDVFRSVLKHELGSAPGPKTLLRQDHQSKGYRDAAEDEKMRVNADLLNKGWNSEITVTTFVSLFNTLIGKTNDDVRRFHRLANSILLLDETQALPVRYWEFMRQSLEIISSSMNTDVITLTATNPKIVRTPKKINQDDSLPHITSTSHDPDLFDRRRYKIDIDTPRTPEDLARHLTEYASNHPNEDILAVVNTKDVAVTCYKAIRDADETVRQELNCLTNRLVPLDRRSVINDIKHSEQSTLTVATQLIEAGVDIDLDYLVRDWATFDSIIQSGGRCNREGEREMGMVRVFRLVNEDHDDQPYASYIYDPVLLQATRSVLENAPDKFGETLVQEELMDDYFRAIHQRKDKDPGNVLKRFTSFDFSRLNESLIEKKYQEVDVVVEVDNRCSSLLSQLEQTYSQVNDFFERRAELRDLYAELNDYQLTVNHKKFQDSLTELPTCAFDDSLLHVEPKRVGSWYTSEIGFAPPEKRLDERIL